MKSPLLIALLLSVSTLYSQENGQKENTGLKQKTTVQDTSKIYKTTSENQVNNPQKLSVGTKKDDQGEKNNTTPYTRTLEDVENDIKNIETKMEWIKNNPEEDKIAKEEGWYEEMEQRLVYLRAEREKHLNKNK